MFQNADEVVRLPHKIARGIAKWITFDCVEDHCQGLPGEDLLDVLSERVPKAKRGAPICQPAHAKCEVHRDIIGICPGIEAFCFK